MEFSWRGVRIHDTAPVQIIPLLGRQSHPQNKAVHCEENSKERSNPSATNKQQKDSYGKRGSSKVDYSTQCNTDTCKKSDTFDPFTPSCKIQTVPPGSHNQKSTAYSLLNQRPSQSLVSTRLAFLLNEVTWPWHVTSNNLQFLSRNG